MDRSLVDARTRAGREDLDAAVELRAALRTVSSHQGGAVGELVVTVAHACADGRWRRVRLCAAPDCRWAFHDTSRSGAGRWCAMAVCGNRHKTRTYRSTQRAKEAG